MRTAKFIRSWLEQNTASGYLHWCKSKWINGETLRGFFALQIKTRTLWRHTINTIRAQHVYETPTHIYVFTSILTQSVYGSFFFMICIRQRCFSRIIDLAECVCVYLRRSNPLTFQFHLCIPVAAASTVLPTQSNRHNQIMHTPLAFLSIGFVINRAL